MGHSRLCVRVSYQEPFRLITVSPDIDAAMTTSTNSSLWRSASTLFRTRFIKDCRVFFYLPRSHNNNCGVPQVLVKQTKKEQEKKYTDIQNYIKHMDLRLLCSFTLAGFFKKKKKKVRRFTKNVHHGSNKWMRKQTKNTSKQDAW